MAKKTTAPVTVTQAELIECTIMYKRDQRGQYEQEAEQAEQMDAAALAGNLRQNVKRIDAQLKVLYKLYQFETGNEYGTITM